MVMNSLHSWCEQVVSNPVETLFLDASSVHALQLAYLLGTINAYKSTIYYFMTYNIIISNFLYLDSYFPPKIAFTHP